MSKTQTITVEGHKIAYQEMGEGTPLLLLHGIPTNKSLWRNVMPTLSEIISQFMDELGIAKANVASHDIGGGIAQLMAVNYPEKVNSLILIDSVCFDSWPIPEFESLLEPGVEQETSVDEFVDTLNDFMPKGVYDKSIMTDELKKQYLKQWSNEQGKAALFNNMRRLNKEYTQAIAGELKSLKHETLILWGDEDNFQKPKYAPQLAQTLPNATLTWIEKAGHWVIDEKPERVTSLMGEFLADKKF